MKKIKLKKKRKVRNFITLIIILIIIFTYFIITISSEKIIPILMKNAEYESKKAGVEIIGNSVSKEVATKLKNEDIYSVTKDNSGNISSIDFNPIVVNNILEDVSSIVSKNFKNFESGKINSNNYFSNNKYNKKLKNGVVCLIPMGVVTNNIFLENLGPKIPVKLNLVGSVVSSIKTNIKEYGINSALIEVYIHIEANVLVIIPFKSKEISLNNDVPLSIKIVEGTVPSYLNALTNQDLLTNR